jgi:flavin reductase (DIM6/NTAB) family NADH-FMN oxidoreductase RutF
MSDGWDEVTRLLDYPMYVVTVRAGDHRSGCLVGFATQVSIDPARFLVGLSKNNHTYRVAQHAERLAVHVLSSTDRDLAALFGAETGDDIDKFNRCDWQDGPDRVPVLDAALAWFSGPILEQYPLGDHVGFVIEPDAAEVRQGEADLLKLSAVTDLDPGHDA